MEERKESRRRTPPGLKSEGQEKRSRRTLDRDRVGELISTWRQ